MSLVQVPKASTDLSQLLRGEVRYALIRELEALRSRNAELEAQANGPELGLAASKIATMTTKEAVAYVKGQSNLDAARTEGAKE